ncbi:hypothetical protein VTJ83DRAFT_3696 [Remersonia thermophila]|uniref:Uncharacterized protein n=1 Tax=Remersonia thermophila TaxID=72144 RepID=A0ABR4DES1_9PEZI
MKLTSTLLVAAQVLSVLALPAPQETTSDVATTATVTETSTSASATATATAAPGAGEGEENKENEIEQQGQFNRVIRLGGGNVKIDTLFPAGVNGVFEVEFQNQQARNLRVRENRNPAPPPKGFTALEPVSYIVELSGNPRNVALQKIDYIRNANSTVDISQGQIARFCREAQAFVFGEGELEFEAEENELTLTVSNMVGEWAFFVPSAGAGAGAGAGEAGNSAETGAGAGAADQCGPGTLCRALLDALQGLTGQAGAQRR